MAYNETIAIWMMCQGDSTQNISLSITAVFYSNYSLPADVTSSSDGSGSLSSGGIAGITIACVVAFLFIVGLLISLKGTLWCKNQFKCCKNQTQSIPEESPRDKDLERRETGLDGKHEPIGHQPSNQVPIQPSATKNGPPNVLSGLLDNDIHGSSSLSGLNHDLNATGQNLLSNGKDGPSSSYQTNEPSKHTLLPEINIDKMPAAKGWNELDAQQNLSSRVDAEHEAEGHHLK